MQRNMKYETSDGFIQSTQRHLHDRVFGETISNSQTLIAGLHPSLFQSQETLDQSQKLRRRCDSNLQTREETEERTTAAAAAKKQKHT
jgi:hypothetical protein